MLLLLGLAVAIVRVSGVIGRAAFSSRIAVVRLILTPPIVLRSMHHVLHLYPGHRLAKKVPRLNHRLNRVALQDALN